MSDPDQRVLRLIQGRENADELAQMLGLAEYESADVNASYARCGSLHRYRFGCRCDLCVTNQRARDRRKEERRKAGLAQVNTHNRYGYHRGCRCDRCRDDHAAASREKYWRAKERASG